MKELTKENEFQLKKNLYLQFCSCRKTPRKNRENRTHDTFISIFFSIVKINLQKKIVAIFEQSLKMGFPCASCKETPNFKQCFSKSQSYDSSLIDKGSFNLKKKPTYGLGARSIHRRMDRRTFCRQLVFRYQGLTRPGFWLHFVLEIFFS